MPYRLNQAYQRMMIRLGSREHTVRSNGLHIRVRRLTVDEEFVGNIIERREYLPDGVTIQPTDTVVDIGGNIGTFAVLAASLAPRGRVISIEPDPENLALLRENVRLNGSNVTVIPAAIAGERGPRTLFLAGQHGGGFHTLLEDRQVHDHATTVQAVTLDDVFREHAVERCNFLKIDCEGAEWEFLPKLGADVWSRVDQIAMEYHTPRTGDGEAVISATFDLIRSHGFQIHHLTRFPPPSKGGHLFARRP